jgi:purine-binding chemotaxis protein CheW
VIATDVPAVEQLLRRRAEQLARLPLEPTAADDVEVLVCRLGAERYAVETRLLRAVQWTRQVAPVPCTPAHVVGIVNVRGEIVTLLDLATMVGLASAPREAEAYAVLLLDVGGMRSGLVVDEILGVERLVPSALQRSLSGRDYTRGLAGGRTVLLDLEQLLAAGRFDVVDDAA